MAIEMSPTALKPFDQIWSKLPAVQIEILCSGESTSHGEFIFRVVLKSLCRFS